MTPPRARFGGIDIVPQDTAASLAFYRELGLDIPDDQVWSVNGVAHHVDLHFEGEYGFDIDSQALTTGYDPGWKPGTRLVVMFRTDTREDVDTLHDHMLSLGHPSHKPPFDAFWGARYAVIVDPDGIYVSLMSPMDKSMGGPPPEL